MHKGYSSHCVCVCLSVCYHASCYIPPRLYAENMVPLSFLHHFLLMHCVDFTKNALFRSSGDICWSPLPCLLLDRISMDKIVSDGFFSRWLVSRSSDRCYISSTGWSLDRVRLSATLFDLKYAELASLLYYYVHVTCTCTRSVTVM